MLSIFIIPAGLTYYLGRMVRHQKHGWSVWAAMFLLFLIGVLICWRAESVGNPRLTAVGVDQAYGNMEGKEVRFGIFNSALFATVTTDASCGAVNSMHDSFTPLGGLVPLFNIQLGEVVFGGVGAGLFGMLVFVVLAIFLAGLMVGRTPEYLGKKIESFDIQVAALAILVPIVFLLGFTAVAASTEWGVKALNNAGPHGFSEMLYAFTSLHRQQRQRLCGPVGQHPLVQPDPGAGDAGRALLAHRAGPGPGREPGRQEDRPRKRRQLPGLRGDLHAAPHRHGPHRGGPDLLSGHQPGPHCGTLFDAAFHQAVLTPLTLTLSPIGERG